MSLQVNFIAVDRHWFLTWTVYGTWLPGDDRGFVGLVTDESGQLVNHNKTGSPPAFPNPRLQASAVRAMKSPPLVLHATQAKALLEQFLETSQFRSWLPIAIGIMRTHIHVLIGVPGDPNPEKIHGDLKSYGSRRLNQEWPKPKSDTWWTSGGSKRKLANEHAVETVANYIRLQSNPLLIWTREAGLSEEATIRT